MRRRSERGRISCGNSERKSRNGRSRSKRGGSKKQVAKSRQTSKHKNQRQLSSLKPVKVSSSSIHSHWKRELGGIIRYYINASRHPNEKDAQKEIESMYYKSGCSVQDTKEAILKALGVTKEIQKSWIEMSMAVGSEGLNVDKSILDGFSPTVDNKGVKLHQVQRAGEGPAHKHEQWTNVIVPKWSIGKSFFFQVENNSPIDLSCEMILDGHKVARNVPLPKRSTRTVRPDATRYFQPHQWVLQPAKRVKLQDEVAQKQTQSHEREKKRDKALPKTPRYNGIRPNYNGKRVSLASYPDPTSFGGWTFTGSVEASRVEFFELKTNMGIVKMDFYYTTATIKTVLDHPSTGTNQLFRNTVTPEEYVQILQNPRSHTGRGYRTADRRGPDIDVEMENDFDKAEGNASSSETNLEMETESAVGSETGNTDTATFYAKNDNYDFKTQGHSNRRFEMHKLHQNNEFCKWEQAAKEEWAMVHARFYIALPKRQRRAPPQTVNSNRGVRNPRSSGKNNLEPLPEQKPVVDIKAAENATLGTKFHAIGAPNRPRRRSAVKMQRIKGLNDDDSWKGGPLFECKLYYRAEEIFAESDSGMDTDDGMDDEDEDIDSKLREGTSIKEYKSEKVHQVKQYLSEQKGLSPEDAEEMLVKCQTKMMLCDNFSDIDELVRLYYEELMKGEFYGKNGGKGETQK